MQESFKFAKALLRSWQKKSRKARFSEIQQFRALMRSFASLSGSFKLEEFHGAKHQVVFNGKGSWGRPIARCEISDLLIISYKTQPEFQARATFLQAKKSDKKHFCPHLNRNSILTHSFKANLRQKILSSGYQPVSAYPTLNCPYNILCDDLPRSIYNQCLYRTSIITHSFKANLEQWDLLSRRPQVLPYPPFKCPPGILHDALLSSVGSFGIFHKIQGKHTDFFYLSADMAEPIGAPAKKHSTLQIKAGNQNRRITQYDECVFALPLYFC